MDKRKENEMLSSKLEEYFRQKPTLKGTLVGIRVISGKTGEILIDHMGELRMRPASNMKLFTAAAALSVLGAEYTFTTTILTDGTIENGVLYGNIYIKGKGDPSLLPQDIEKLVKQLTKQKITYIDGDIIADDTWYDDIRLSQDMIWSDEVCYYGSQVSALTTSPNADYDTGTIILSIKPSNRPGEEPIITIYPETDYVKIENKVQTVAHQVDEDALVIERIREGNTIIIKGEISVQSKIQKEWIAISDPTFYTLTLFEEALEKENINWSGKLRKETTPNNATILYEKKSPKLKKLLIPFMKLSNNGLGELFVKEMGKIIYNEGSWEKGLKVLKTEISKLGVCLDHCVIRDGSGISHVTAIPPREICNLLYHVQKKQWYAIFLQALPIAGEKDRMVGGTMKDRSFHYSVQAKTGILHTVSTLSGYLNLENKGQVIFSIMLNHLMDEEDGPDLEGELITWIGDILKVH